MAASNAKSGMGTILSSETTPGGGTHANIAEVRGISGPSMSAETDDVTHMESPSNVREFISTLVDGGEVTFGINFIEADAAAQALLRSDLTGLIKREYKITEPGGANDWTFDAVVTRFEPDHQPDAAIQAQVTLKVAGAPVFAATA